MLHDALIGRNDYRRQNQGVALMILPYPSLSFPTVHERITDQFTMKEISSYERFGIVFSGLLMIFALFFVGKEKVLKREGEKTLTIEPSIPPLLHFFFLRLMFLFPGAWRGEKYITIWIIIDQFNNIQHL